MNFVPFPKIPRLSREIVITEKIDGTNASVAIVRKDSLNHNAWSGSQTEVVPLVESDGLVMLAASRSRWIYPGKEDNHGFAGWAKENATELFKLGEGQHFGEWWGAGIQRGYGLDHKRFSLFNVGRWNEENKPSCCHVVPILFKGTFDAGIDYGFQKDAIVDCLWTLENRGSVAAPGFMDPEGIIIYHTAASAYFKKTIVGDEKPKGSNE